MKKSFPVNISGIIYYFDEDAYNLLNKYYSNLRQSFPGEDGAEIVADIESRVAEIISELHNGENRVVTIEDVNSIIGRVGRPDQINDPEVSTTFGEEPAATPPPITPRAYAGTPTRRRLYRNIDNKVIAGVLSGLACYFGCSVTALRIAVVVLACFIQVWPLVGLYIVAWILIPAAETPRQILEMNGESVTVDNVGRSTILGTRDPGATSGSKDVWPSIGRIIGVVVMSFLGLTGIVLGISMIVLLVTSVVSVVSYLAFDKVMITAGTEHSPLFVSAALFTTALAWLIPCIAACWAACCTLFKIRGASRRAVIILAIIEFILIVVSISMCVALSAYSFNVYPFGRL